MFELTASNLNQKEIIQRIEVNKSITRSTLFQHASKLDKEIMGKWKFDDYKTFGVQKVKFKNLEFLNTQKTNIVRINDEDYYIGSLIPANTSHLKGFDPVRAYTLFNVLYYIEKDYTTQYITLGASTLGAIVPAVASLIFYNNYKNADTSSDAETLKKSTTTASFISIIGVGNLLYQLYRYYGDLIF